jgi:Lrp/AsnC family transcriptional regulator for asnA, asnC and gidA
MGLTPGLDHWPTQMAVLDTARGLIPGHAFGHAFTRSGGSRLTRCDARWYKSLALRSVDQLERRGAVSRPRRLDRVDQRLIEALQKNGREPFRRIAADVGVSEATIRARYQRLCDDNILQVTGVTNPLGLGFEAQAMVGIRTGGAPEPVADAIARWDEVDYVVITAGQFDILVEVVCADRRELLDLTNRIRALEGVVSTESFLYLELWKQLYDWGARLQDGERVRVQ